MNQRGTRERLPERAFLRSQAMANWFQGPWAQVVIWTAAGAMLVVAAKYVVGWARDSSSQQEPTASDLISKFRDLHSEGVLSDAEFRTIKTSLAARLQEEIKDTGETS
jgi:hypothetical protein